MPAEQVIIEFISDTSQLESSTDVLEQQGKVEKQVGEEFKKTNSEILKQQKALDQIGAVTRKIDEQGKVTKKNLSDLAKIIKSQSSTFQAELQKGVIETLQQAGIEAQEFGELLESAVGPSTKQQLRAMTEELARMKVEGRDNTEQYRLLSLQAGQLKDAIGDANQEIKNFGSDTRTIDGVISLAGGITGGFAAAQGAAALFGDENKDLQETLLRVNAAMSILQGIQQIQIVLQKESAAATLANTIATRAQTIAQVAFNFVVGASTGLLKAFRIALASTGIGLLVLGVIALVDALKDSNDELEEANALIEKQKNLVESLNDALDSQTKLQEARAKAAGDAESSLIIIQGRALQQRRNILTESNRALAEQRKGLDQTSEAYKSLNDQILNNNDAIDKIDVDLQIKQIELEKRLADERAEALKKRQDAEKKAAEEARRLAAERRAAEFEDFKAGIELQLLAAKEGSEQQLKLRKDLLRAELQIDLENEKLTLNQRKLLIQKFFRDRLDLDKKFASDRDKNTLEEIAADLQAELQALELSNERKLELTEATINLAAAMEVDAANGNAAKIGEINAKRDKAIRDARIASIKQVADYEIALASAQNGPEQRRLQQTIENADEETSVRIDAVKKVAQLESIAIQRRIEALNEEKQKRLISQEDYDLQYAQLVDQQLQVFETSEKKKTDILNAESEKRKQKTLADIQAVLDAASQVVTVLDSLFQLQSQREDQSLSERKDRLAKLREAGAITEKEAIAQQKHIEAEEKRIRREQAEREKKIAVFNAAIAIPQAVLKGLSVGGPILAAVYGALASAQLAIVAARPIPKFGKGKKDKYQGFAEVGETGAELIESNGKMWVAPTKQVVWLGKDDKVYNPQETISMLSSPSFNAEKVSVPVKNGGDLKIDYKKIGKEVGKNIPQVGWNFDEKGFVSWVKGSQQFTTDLNKRRSF